MFIKLESLHQIQKTETKQQHKKQQHKRHQQGCNDSSLWIFPLDFSSAVNLNFCIFRYTWTTSASFTAKRWAYCLLILMKVIKSSILPLPFSPITTDVSWIEQCRESSNRSVFDFHIKLEFTMSFTMTAWLPMKDVS